MDEASNEGLNSEFDNDNEEYDDDDYEDDYENRISNANVNNNGLCSLQNVDEDTFSVNGDNKSLKKKRNDLSRYSKKRKCRTTFTKSQLINLEKEFTKSNFISNDRIDLLIDITGLDSRIIKVLYILKTFS